MNWKPAQEQAESDFLVSIVLADAAEVAPYREVLLPLSQRLASAFQFWEIVIAIPEAGEIETSAFVSALKGIPNLRILQVSEAGSFYRRRLAGVTEAIGDVVLLSTLDEIELVDLASLSCDIYLSNSIFILTREQSSSVASAAFADLLASLSGYRVNTRDSLTIGFPRTALEHTLSRPDAEILLRFEPLSGVLKFNRLPLPGKQPARRWQDWRRRLALVGAMMTSAGPRILRMIALVAFFVACIALLYASYAVLVWLFKPDVAPGWLTSSLIQSLTSFLLGISVSAICMGLVRVLDLLLDLERYAIVDEINTVDLIGRIKSTNVELIVDTSSAMHRGDNNA
jgi:hypothetical protein